MMVGITGTPGTGKTSVAGELKRRGYHVVHLKETIEPYILEEDRLRDTLVVDVERWAGEFPPVAGIVEGHLAHLLPCDRVVILRCRPDILVRRLGMRKGYRDEKIAENAEAEALDVILIETLEEHTPEHILELDTTDSGINEIADKIEGFMRGELPPSLGSLDWSGFLVGEYDT
jgi:adenylate kinase